MLYLQISIAKKLASYVSSYISVVECSKYSLLTNELAISKSERLLVFPFKSPDVHHHVLPAVSYGCKLYARIILCTVTCIGSPSLVHAYMAMVYRMGSEPLSSIICAFHNACHSTFLPLSYKFVWKPLCCVTCVKRLAN